MDVRGTDRRTWRCCHHVCSSGIAAILRIQVLLLALFASCSWLPVAAAGPSEAATTVHLDTDSSISRCTDLSLVTPKYKHLEVRLLYPEQGKPTPATTLFRCLVHRQRELLTGDSASYYQKASACRLCLELDGYAPPLFCWRPAIHGLQHAGSMQEQMMPVQTLAAGNYSARCFVSCSNSTAEKGARIGSESVRFSVVPDTWWASSRDTQPRVGGLQSEAGGAPSLVIGVKTSMRWGLPLRQAIRETWASISSLPPGVRVVFLGCRVPLEASADTDHARRTLAYAIELERSAHNDLLIDELGDCEDSYEGLVGKVAAFLRYVTTRYATSVPTVMVADDDVYIDVNQLMRLVREHLSSTQECVYAGQVWEKQFSLLVEPVRDRNSKYYVSEQVYPMKHWPPFAFGPHYLLSASCLGLVLDNQRLVGEFRGLDDVSIAVWLLASGVRPRHVPQFKNLRDTACFDNDEGIISLADVSTTALCAIHRNLRSGRPFCHESDLSVWLR